MQKKGNGTECMFLFPHACGNLSADLSVNTNALFLGIIRSDHHAWFHGLIQGSVTFLALLTGFGPGIILRAGHQ